MKKLSILSILAVFVLSISAYGYHHKHKMHNWWEKEDVVEKLQLSDSQLNEINKIDESYKDQLETLHNEVRDIRDQLRVMMNDPKSTNEQITSKHDEKVAKKTELGKVWFEKKLKVRDVLNDEQIVKIGEIKKERWEGHRKQCK